MAASSEFILVGTDEPSLIIYDKDNFFQLKKIYQSSVPTEIKIHNDNLAICVLAEQEVSFTKLKDNKFRKAAALLVTDHEAR